jgi:hypothetical protein
MKMFVWIIVISTVILGLGLSLIAIGVNDFVNCPSGSEKINNCCVENNICIINTNKDAGLSFLIAGSLISTMSGIIIFCSCYYNTIPIEPIVNHNANANANAETIVDVESVRSSVDTQGSVS